MTAKKSLGFYLHTSWEFAYPFAVRSWQRADFNGFFALMAKLGFNLVMFWPLSEAMPAPLSEADRHELESMRALVDDAHRHGLQFWTTFCANVTSTPAIADKSFKQRHLYPFRVDVRLDEPEKKVAYMKHRAQIQNVLNNADGYVTIDGDPGGYPGAQPSDFLEVLRHDRAHLNDIGRTDAKIIPWLWSGWGGDWQKYGPWQEPLEPLTEPLLQLIADSSPSLQPLEFLPGRSITEAHANGRKNFEMVERAELAEQSTLLCYEIVEFEPTPPATVIQFDDIRRVLRQEKPLLDKARGLMGNAQQPIMALPNLFFFARAAQHTEYLERSDLEVLRDLAEFLGGDENMLIPAWECLRRDTTALPADLPQRLRETELKSEVAHYLPGGARLYVEILAAFVEARLGVLRACAAKDDDVARETGIGALKKWWDIHRYVFSGEDGTEFSLAFTHPLLRAPLEARLQKKPGN